MSATVLDTMRKDLGEEVRKLLTPILQQQQKQQQSLAVLQTVTPQQQHHNQDRRDAGFHHQKNSGSRQRQGPSHSSRADDRKQGIKCYRCSGMGHYSYDCTSVDTRNAGSSRPGQPSVAQQHSSAQQQECFVCRRFCGAERPYQCANVCTRCGDPRQECGDRCFRQTSKHRCAQCGRVGHVEKACFKNYPSSKHNSYTTTSGPQPRMTAQPQAVQARTGPYVHPDRVLAPVVDTRDDTLERLERIANLVYAPQKNE